MERKQKALMEAAKKQQKIEKVMQEPSFRKLNDCEERISTMIADDFEQLCNKDEENENLNESDNWKKVMKDQVCLSLEMNILSHNYATSIFVLFFKKKLSCFSRLLIWEVVANLLKKPQRLVLAMRESHMSFPHSNLLMMKKRKMRKKKKI